MDKTVLSMGILRVISGSIELIAALGILYFGSLEKAMMINAGLAIVGPTVLILVTTIGLIGLAGQISLLKFSFIFLGAVMILTGLFK